MEWREALDDANDVSAVEALLTQVRAEQASLLQQCTQLLDQQNDPPAAVAVVRALMFIDKFSQDLNQRLDKLE
jgi:molecular chaperone HscB